MTRDPETKGRLILLYEVDPPYDVALGRQAVGLGLRVLRTGGEISTLAQRERPCLCVTRVSDPNDVRRVRQLQKLKGSPLVVLGERIGADLTVSLLRWGAVDVIEIPGPTESVVTRALAWCSAGGDPEGMVVGDTPQVRELRDRIARIAPAHTTVLIQGETGTGKGLVARSLHARSPWASEPWVHVDCSALSPTVIESELFGHEKGAFTNALSQRAGRFEQAGKGTIFLDEIGDLDLPLQTKLLRVLQDREFEPVGGTRTLSMRARVIAATSRDLTSDVLAGRFRRDLFFRLAVTRLFIAPLRARSSDIPALVEAFLPGACERLGVPVPRIADSFLDRLRSHRFPGNVRELFNTVERCLVEIRAEMLEAEDLAGMIDDESPLSPATLPRSPSSLREMAVGSDDERRLLERVLVQTGGNVSRAARRLGVSRGTLRYRISAQGLESLVPDD
jgi:DNA-binding NtrC family response regulator